MTQRSGAMWGGKGGGFGKGYGDSTLAMKTSAEDSADAGCFVVQVYSTEHEQVPQKGIISKGKFSSSNHKQ